VPLAGKYRAAIHDDRRVVVSHRRHRKKYNVLVTSGQRYVTIIVLLYWVAALGNDGALQAINI
jgi:hypothetical protein